MTKLEKGLLAGISLAALSGCWLLFRTTQDAARVDRQMSHLKLVTQGALLYAQENDGFWPRSERWSQMLKLNIPLPPDEVAMNRSASGIPLSLVAESAEKTVAFFISRRSAPSAVGTADDLSVDSPVLSFFDGRVRKIQIDRLSELRWEIQREP